MLKGYKTYLFVALAAFLTTFGGGLSDPNVDLAKLAELAAIAALRAGVAKIPS